MFMPIFPFQASWTNIGPLIETPSRIWRRWENFRIFKTTNNRLQLAQLNSCNFFATEWQRLSWCAIRSFNQNINTQKWSKSIFFKKLKFKIYFFCYWRRGARRRTRPSALIAALPNPSPSAAVWSATRRKERLPRRKAWASEAGIKWRNG
jgi:hypothetical protein